MTSTGYGKSLPSASDGELSGTGPTERHVREDMLISRQSIAGKAVRPLHRQGCVISALLQTPRHERRDVKGHHTLEFLAPDANRIWGSSVSRSSGSGGRLQWPSPDAFQIAQSHINSVRKPRTEAQALLIENVQHGRLAILLSIPIPPRLRWFFIRPIHNASDNPSPRMALVVTADGNLALTL